MTWGAAFYNSPGLSKGRFVPESRVWGCFVGINACGQGKHLPSLAGHCWRELSSPQHSYCCYNAHIHLNWLQREGEKTRTVNNNSVNCHQWSEQYYRSLLNHRMNMLRNFFFSLKPCVVGRDGSPICSCPSLIWEASAGLSFLPSAPHVLAAEPDHPEILTLLNLSAMKQPGPGERGK